MGLVRDDDTERLAVPNEDAYIEVRVLNWKQLDKARKARSREQIDEAKHFGAELIKAFSTGDADKAKRVAKAMEYDPSQFDATTLLHEAIVGWSYTASVTQTNATDKLHAVTKDWLVAEILRLSSPPTAAEGKKDAADSTPPLAD